MICIKKHTKTHHPTLLARTFLCGVGRLGVGVEGLAGQNPLQGISQDHVSTTLLSTVPCI